jgi:vacuolar-type H+-ATPase subunit E/Vma4
MFAITTSNSFFAFPDQFKKVGKKIQKQRQAEVERIKDKISDIARDEERRVKDIFKQHQDIIKKQKQTKAPKTKSIDLYEK